MSKTCEDRVPASETECVASRYPKVRVGDGRDAGIGLIEILVAVVILGTAGAAVLTAVGAAAFGASTKRAVAEAQTAVTAAADKIAGNSIPFEPCAQPSHYQAQLPAGLAVEVTAVEYWRSSIWDTVCDPTTNSMQLITLESDAGERGSATMQVVKRLLTDSDAEYVVNQDGSGSGVPIGPIEPTAGIDGTTTAAPVTGTTTTTTTTTTALPTTTTTTIPGPAPTCKVTGISVNAYWKDSMNVAVVNSSSHTFDWSDWYVRLSYAGSGAEQNGQFVSTWSDATLTLTPAYNWLNLAPGNPARTLTILEPGGTLSGVSPNSVGCEVVTS